MTRLLREAIAGALYGLANVFCVTADKLTMDDDDEWRAARWKWWNELHANDYRTGGCDDNRRGA